MLQAWRLMIPAMIVTVGFFALAMLLMSLGVMLAGKRLSGSCGGVPGSDACKCTPEKRKRCETTADEQNQTREGQLFGGPTHYAGEEVDDAPLPPPGEERLIQLSRRSE